jgi:hypothetical protein
LRVVERRSSIEPSIRTQIHHVLPFLDRSVAAPGPIQPRHRHDLFQMQPLTSNALPAGHSDATPGIRVW